MTERMTTGSGPLDLVLGGGLPRDAIILLTGAPGAGKSVLAQQWVFANATPERPALYLSTVAEPLDKLLRHGQTLAFFDPHAVGRSVWYEDLGESLRDRGLQGVLDQLRDMIRQRRPAMIVIDSFRAMHPYADRSIGFSPFLHDLAGMLSAFPVTSMWVGEYPEEEVTRVAEFAVADAIVSMGTAHTVERTTRTLQVHKLRGGGFLAGKHLYGLSADGVTVLPSIADRADRTDRTDLGGYELVGRRVASRIQALRRRRRSWWDQ